MKKTKISLLEAALVDATANGTTREIEDAQEAVDAQQVVLDAVQVEE